MDNGKNGLLLTVTKELKKLFWKIIAAVTRNEVFRSVSAEEQCKGYIYKIPLSPVKMKVVHFQ